MTLNRDLKEVRESTMQLSGEEEPTNKTRKNIGAKDTGYMEPGAQGL